jgi:hypothetical protein
MRSFVLSRFPAIGVREAEDEEVSGNAKETLNNASAAAGMAAEAWFPTAARRL